MADKTKSVIKVGDTVMVYKPTSSRDYKYMGTPFIVDSCLEGVYYLNGLPNDHLGFTADELVHLTDATVEKFITKDSGKRVDFESGMRRDVDEGKPRYDLVEPVLLKRIADLYARGAEKYGDNNWQLANSEEEMLRFRASAWRHFMSWANGWDTEEDHAAAIYFNVAAYEYVKRRLKDESS